MKNGAVSPIALWNLLSLVAIVAIIGAVVFRVLTPTANRTSSALTHSTVSEANATAADSQARLDAKTWKLDTQELGGSVLSHLTTKADKLHVHVDDFRIDKLANVSGQTEAPFVVVLDGDFNDVVKMLSELESPESKLGVGLLQLTTSDRGPGFVKATLGLTAFLEKVS